MRKISGKTFKSEERIDVMIDKFEEMTIEIEMIKLARNLEYALSVQFLERLENCGKINAVEQMRLKDVIEEVYGNPRAGKTLAMMKKQLRKTKVIENIEEPFKKESKAYFVRNENNRGRYDDWIKIISSKGYVRLDSYPNFFRI